MSKAKVIPIRKTPPKKIIDLNRIKRIQESLKKIDKLLVELKELKDKEN